LRQRKAHKPELSTCTLTVHIADILWHIKRDKHSEIYTAGTLDAYYIHYWLCKSDIMFKNITMTPHPPAINFYRPRLEVFNILLPWV
jgi:hypothetical protein